MKYILCVEKDNAKEDVISSHDTFEEVKVARKNLRGDRYRYAFVRYGEDILSWRGKK